MNRTILSVAACALLLVLVSEAQAQAPATEGQTPGGREIQMTAKKYAFNPSVITVKKGERVRLIITALDHDHGFKLEAFGINQVLKKGALTTIEFTAEKLGTFEFKCSNFCGLGHGRMKGMLIVEEASNP